MTPKPSRHYYRGLLALTLLNLTISLFLVSTTLISVQVDGFVLLGTSTTVNGKRFHQILRKQRETPVVARQLSLEFSSSKNNDENNNDSICFDLDPHSDYAQHLLNKVLGLTEKQQQQIVDYCGLILEWNQRVNLVSRKDCSLDVIFGRHVLPCLAPKLLDNASTTAGIQPGSHIADVGTGGGFPGIPLAIAFPDSNFLLVDSVGKKLNAVDDMVLRLGLSNVKTQHSRAEEVTGPDGRTASACFDWCVGRSVASLPTFCSWVHHLVKPSKGKLLYIIGGEVPEAVLAESDYSIHDLFVANNNDDEAVVVPGSNASLISEKRMLVFPNVAVQRMAKDSGSPPHSSGHQTKNANMQDKRRVDVKGVVNRQKQAKGAWKRNSVSPKQRGYEDFQRYESK